MTIARFGHGMVECMGWAYVVGEILRYPAILETVITVQVASVKLSNACSMLRCK